MSDAFAKVNGDTHKWGAIVCRHCGARGPDVNTDADYSDTALWRAIAILAWNGRSEPHEVG